MEGLNEEESDIEYLIVEGMDDVEVNRACITS